MPLTYEIWYDLSTTSSAPDVSSSGSSLALRLISDHTFQHFDTAGIWRDVPYIRITYSKNATEDFPTGSFIITTPPSGFKVEPSIVEKYPDSDDTTSLGTAIAERLEAGWQIEFTSPMYMPPATSAGALWKFGTAAPPPRLKVIVKRQDLTAP